MILLAAAGNAKVLWFLTRGTGVVALLLLTAGVVLGVTISTRWAAPRLPRFVVSGLHRNITLLAVAFVTAHVVTTVADHFAPIGYKDAVLPFLSPYRPIWLGLGAVAFDLLLALIATSLLRARIGLRTWRAVHWLAYASWPVALMHSLGTGSDARAGWMAVLGIGCAGAVAAAVLWRAGAAVAPAQVRTAAAVAAVAVPLGVLVWAKSGPLRAGWAARAGTPKSLLGFAARSSAAANAGSGPSVSTSSNTPLPAGTFDASFRGRVKDNPTPNGLVVVSIDGAATGGFVGHVHVALRGVPLPGGGVEMLASSVGLLPSGASAWYAGTVVGLEGQRVSADVAASGGRNVHVRLTLHIDPASGRVTGSIRGSSGGQGPSA